MNDSVRRGIFGGVVLSASNILSRALSYLFIIILTYFLSEREFGIYMMVFPLLSTLLIFTSSGIAPTVSHFEAKRNAFFTALIIFLAIGIVIMLMLFFLAPSPVSYTHLTLPTN